MALQSAHPALSVGRCCLASLLQFSEGHSATLLGRSSAAFSSQTAARGSEQASTSGRDSAKSGKAAGRPTAKGSGGKPTSSDRSKPNPAASAASSPAVDFGPAAAASHFAPIRLAQYARTVLHRELMLKLQPRSWDAVPRLVALEASIRASETQLERDIVDKWELLFYNLALEVMTGRPAGFTLPPGARQNSSRATGVSVRLDARTDPDATYGFLEKLVHVLLPSQMGFEGVTPPRLMANTPEAPREEPLEYRVAPMRRFVTDLALTNLLALPDFEQNFALFERLRGMRVRIEVEGVRREDCNLLLSGLSVPVLTGAAAEAALAEAEAEDLRRRRR